MYEYKNGHHHPTRNYCLSLGSGASTGGYAANALKRENNGFLMLGVVDPNNRKTELAKHAAQIAIDKYHIVRNFDGDPNSNIRGWPPNGGHGVGRLGPILIGAKLLGQTAWITWLDTITDPDGTLESRMAFAETGQVQEAKATGINEATYGRLSNAVKGVGSGAKDAGDSLGRYDGGGTSNSTCAGQYQSCCTWSPWKTELMAVLLVPTAYNAWKYTPFLEYMDRMVSYGSRCTGSAWPERDARDPIPACRGGANEGDVCHNDAECPSSTCYRGWNGYMSTFADQMWELYYECAKTASCTGMSASTCGNDTKEPGEDCDGTDLDSETCITQGYDSGTLDCVDPNDPSPCTFDVTGCSGDAPSCGDGELDDGEQCDDGNASNTDACLNSCLDAYCGDGYVLSGTEDCDSADPNSPGATEDANCDLDCSSVTCGDNYVNVSASEECDGTDITRCTAAGCSTDPNTPCTCVNDPNCGDNACDISEVPSVCFADCGTIRADLVEHTTQLTMISGWTTGSINYAYLPQVTPTEYSNQITFSAEPTYLTDPNCEYNWNMEENICVDSVRFLFDNDPNNDYSRIETGYPFGLASDQYPTEPILNALSPVLPDGQYSVRMTPCSEDWDISPSFDFTDNGCTDPNGAAGTLGQDLTITFDIVEGSARGVISIQGVNISQQGGPSDADQCPTWPYPFGDHPGPGNRGVQPSLFAAGGGQER
jgi:cysteine-rich repeat protein